MTRKTKRSLEKELAEIRGDGAGEADTYELTEEERRQLDEVFGGDGEVHDSEEAHDSETVTSGYRELTPEEKEQLDAAFDADVPT